MYSLICIYNLLFGNEIFIYRRFPFKGLACTWLSLSKKNAKHKCEYNF